MVNEFLNKLKVGALLTAINEKGEINTMTVSWGGAGILWGKQVAFVFVRPQRHTFSFTEGGTKMHTYYYSPVYDMYYDTGFESDFTIRLSDFN
jgi:flavin reductase (DIM6/NTAB) family NADH-FMN oxidoreductase RutF